jgi:proline iminopeptidase
MSSYRLIIALMATRDPRFLLCFVRLVTHYWRRAAWLEDERLPRGAGELAA